MESTPWGEHATRGARRRNGQAGDNVRSGKPAAIFQHPVAGPEEAVYGTIANQDAAEQPG